MVNDISTAQEPRWRMRTKYIQMVDISTGRYRREKDIRQSVETDLINFVKNFGEIINKKIPNFKFIKKLCFS